MLPDAFDRRVHEGARGGANTQGATLEEARANLEEAVVMVMDANREMSEQSIEGADVIRETLALPGA